MKFRTMRKMMTKDLGVQAALMIVGAFLIVGCGGGGGGGSTSAGGGSFVVVLDGGQPVTYAEGPMIQGMPDPAMMSSVDSGRTMIMMWANYTDSDPNNDMMLVFMFDGTAAGDYPIGNTNTVMLMKGPEFYMPPVAAPAGTILITRYDGSRIEGEIVGLDLEEETTQNLITFDCNFTMSPGFDMGGFIP